MPEKKQVIEAQGEDANKLQSYCYGAMELLQWNIKYGVEHILIAYTPRKWNKLDDEVTVETRENELTVTSKLIHNESFDISGKNKKHLAEFSAAFEKIKSSATDEQVEEWRTKIAALVENTVEAAEKEILQTQEADKVMNFSKGNMYVTYGIIAINILVFIVMVAKGMDIVSPKPVDVIKWGGNLPPLTLGGEWWRLLSSVFLHFGIVHLLLNMYALYFIGSYLEPMLGKARFITAYLCAGLAASVISVLFHKDTLVTSAGASGAIFGMFGVFLALLTTNIIPKHVKSALLQSVLIFVGFNVFYGFKPNSGIDNAAHLGGLVSGMLIGYLYYFSYKRSSPAKTYSIAFAVIVITLLGGFFIMNKEKIPPKEIDYVSGRLFNKGETSFESKKDEFGPLEEKALAVYQTTGDKELEPKKLADDLQTISIPAWEEAKVVAAELEKRAITDRQKKIAELLKQYVVKRIDLDVLQIKSIKENSTVYDVEMKQLVEEINELVAGLKKSNSQ